MQTEETSQGLYTDHWIASIRRLLRTKMTIWQKTSDRSIVKAYFVSTEWNKRKVRWFICFKYSGTSSGISTKTPLESTVANCTDGRKGPNPRSIQVKATPFIDNSKLQIRPRDTNANLTSTELPSKHKSPAGTSPCVTLAYWKYMKAKKKNYAENKLAKVTDEQEGLLYPFICFSILTKSLNKCFY